jgi:hypothetical protein
MNDMFGMPVWHWDAEGWNDRAVEFEVVTAVNKGLIKPRVWSWPVLKAYNGSSGEERIRGWQKTWAGIHLKLIPPPRTCSICGSRRAVQYHNEDYLRPMNAKPVCSTCHKVLHKRFSNEGTWLRLVRDCEYDGCWFSDLILGRERSIEEAEVQRSKLQKWNIDVPAPLSRGLTAL